MLRPLFRRLARAAGLEPTTDCLEGSCSIQLSYARVRSDYTMLKPGRWEMATCSRASQHDLRSSAGVVLKKFAMHLLYA